MGKAVEAKSPDQEAELEYIHDMTCQLAVMADEMNEQQLSNSLQAAAELRKTYDLAETKPPTFCSDE